MPKTKISEFSATPGNNTDIDGINIAEGCAPSGINDAIRELMAQLKDFQAGTAGDSFNGPVGTTTAAAGAFTTLTTSSTVTHNGGTANGVAYLNGSKVLTTGSALTFDGTNLGVGTATPSTWSSKIAVVSTGTSPTVAYLNGSAASNSNTVSTEYWAANTFTGLDKIAIFGAVNPGTGNNNGNFYWSLANAGAPTEQMRLTSTGLGIGTSSPYAKIQVYTSSSTNPVGWIYRGTQGSSSSIPTTFGYPYLQIGAAEYNSSASSIQSIGFGYVSANGAPPPAEIGIATTSTSGQTYGDLVFATRNVTTSTAATERMRLDSSGNLGLGVTPSAWNSSFRAMQLGNSGYLFGRASQTQMEIGNNAVFDATDTRWEYITTNTAQRYLQDGTSGSHQWFIAPSGTAGNAITFTQAMTLDASGNLLLGTTAASYSSANRGLIEMNGSTDSLIAMKRGNSSATSATIQYNASNLEFRVVDNLPMTFFTNNTERARITSGGDVYINTSTALSSTAKLQISNGTGRAIATAGSSGDVGTESLRIGKFDNDSTTSQLFVRFTINNDGAGSGQINANGASAAAFGTYSDERLKENIVNLPSQISNICALRPVEFDYKDGSGHQIGFIAQEMQQIYPDVVSTGDEGMLTVTGWSKTEARLVKAIQEQQVMINELKAEVAALKAK